MDIIPSDLATYGAEAKKLLQDLQSRNCLLYTSSKENLVKTQDLEYNKDEVQKNRVPSGLCG